MGVGFAPEERFVQNFEVRRRSVKSGHELHHICPRKVKSKGNKTKALENAGRRSGGKPGMMHVKVYFSVATDDKRALDTSRREQCRLQI